VTDRQGAELEGKVSSSGKKKNSADLSKRTERIEAQGRKTRRTWGCRRGRQKCSRPNSCMARKSYKSRQEGGVWLHEDGAKKGRKVPSLSHPDSFALLVGGNPRKRWGAWIRGGSAKGKTSSGTIRSAPVGERGESRVGG